jgi:hypothetical protein
VAFPEEPLHLLLAHVNMVEGPDGLEGLQEADAALTLGDVAGASNL